MRIFHEELATAGRIIDVRAVHGTCADGLPGSEVIPAGVPHALAICTIGKQLEERVQELIAQGDSARGMILDAIGSAAVEEVANRLNGELCDKGLAEGRKTGLRSSPGYGKWAVTEQPLIFDLLRPEDVGVALNASCVMDPAKSISFARPREGGENARGPRGRCARCGMGQCEYRVIPPRKRSKEESSEV